MLNYRLLRMMVVLVELLICASAHCPKDKMKVIKPCEIQIQCSEYIRNVSLPEQCTGNTTHPVYLHVKLTDAVERVDHDADPEILRRITTFQVSGNWSKTALSFLSLMPHLRVLYLTNNNMQHITPKPFYHLTSLEMLDLSYNKLHDVQHLFHFKDTVNSLKVLYLSFNKITKINEMTFNELNSLTELDLSHNDINHFTRDSFNGLVKLEVLKLNDNNIVGFQSAVNNLKHLRHLYLRGNKLDTVDIKSMFVSHQLQTFDVSDNNLTLLNGDVFHRHPLYLNDNAVVRIVLAENDIETLASGSIHNNISPKNVNVRTEIDLSHNKLRIVEFNAFENCVKLTSLDLSVNKLMIFNTNVTHLMEMKYLNVSKNQIQMIYYESFSSMRHLKYLDLSYNLIAFVPEGTFKNNCNLKYLYISHNIIKNMHVNTFDRDGGLLDLSYNGLNVLTIPITEGYRLHTLILSSNNITDMAHVKIQSQTHLTKLQLNRNAIQEVNTKTFHLPTSLVDLDMSYNKIHTITPSVFTPMVNLSVLRLSHNHLHELHYGTFQGLRSLRELDLSFNRINRFSSKVMSELKSLVELHLGYNDMISLDYKDWIGHRFNLHVYIDGNSLTCEWVKDALNDYNRGLSKMKPMMRHRWETGHSVDGVPCVMPVKRSESLEAIDDNTNYRVETLVADERLLVMTKKILEAIREQTGYIKFNYRRMNRRSFGV